MQYRQTIVLAEGIKTFSLLSKHIYKGSNAVFNGGEGCLHVRGALQNSTLTIGRDQFNVYLAGNSRKINIQCI